MENVTEFDQNRRRTKLDESGEGKCQLICFSDIRRILAERIQMRRSQEMLERLGFTGKVPHRYIENNPNGNRKEQIESVQSVLTPKNKEGLRLVALLGQVSLERQREISEHPDFPRANK